MADGPGPGGRIGGPAAGAGTSRPRPGGEPSYNATHRVCEARSRPRDDHRGEGRRSVASPDGPRAAAAAESRTLPDGESPESRRDYYGQMVLIRTFELRAAEMCQRGRIGAYCHLRRGEDATVVGLMAPLEPRDYLFTTYREHGY